MNFLQGDIAWKQDEAEALVCRRNRGLPRGLPDIPFAAVRADCPDLEVPVVVPHGGLPANGRFLLEAQDLPIGRKETARIGVDPSNDDALPSAADAPHLPGDVG